MLVLVISFHAVRYRSLDFAATAEYRLRCLYLVDIGDTFDVLFPPNHWISDRPQEISGRGSTGTEQTIFAQTRKHRGAV